MKISKDSFMSRDYDDYQGNYNKYHYIYVATFISKDGKEQFAKLGTSHYVTNYRFQKETNYVLQEVYEFYFKTALESFGIEAMVKAQWTKKFNYTPSKYTVGHSEVFQVEQVDETIHHIRKAREAFGITSTLYIEQDKDHIYHDYRTEHNPWQQ